MDYFPGRLTDVLMFDKVLTAEWSPGAPLATCTLYTGLTSGHRGTQHKNTNLQITFEAAAMPTPVLIPGRQSLEVPRPVPAVSEAAAASQRSVVDSSL